MIVQFKRNGKTFSGTVLARGFHNVDKPESYQVAINDHVEFWVPVADCHAA